MCLRCSKRYVRMCRQSFSVDASFRAPCFLYKETEPLQWHYMCLMVLQTLAIWILSTAYFRLKTRKTWKLCPEPILTGQFLWQWARVAEIISIFYASAFRRRRHYVFGLSVRPKPEIASFDLYMCPLVHPTNRNRFTARPSVCPSVRLSVRPSGEVSGHLPENAWREWPEILHADVSWLSSELISLWLRSVDFSNFGAILT